jgi:uncharacterized ion transporter superfamily protein YfcC
MGIPLELITMLGSSLMSAVMTLWAKKMEADKQRTEMLIKVREQEANAVDAARRFSNQGFMWTRRIVTILAVLAIVVWPKVVPVFWPDVLTVVGWTQWNPGFWIFEGAEETQFKYLKGLVITPLDTHLMSAIVGLYFGASMVKNVR